MTVFDRLVVDPRTAPEWNTLTERARSAVFASPLWIGAIADTYGFAVDGHVLVDDGQVMAGLACAAIHDFRGARLISLPYCDYLDPVVADDEQWHTLVAPLFERRLPFQLRVRRNDVPERDARFAAGQ